MNFTDFRLRTPRFIRPSPKGLTTWVLVGLGIWSILSLGSLGNLRLDSFELFGDVIKGAFTPELSPSYVHQIFLDMLTTVSYAVAAMSLAVLLGFSAGAVSSGVLFGKLPALPGRFLLTVFRSMHELIWALLFVQMLGLSPWAGVLAIAVPYGGIIGRIFADQLNDAPAAPVSAVHLLGASRLSVLFYSRLPPMRGSIFSYLTYRFECGLRSATVLSFVGLGGLGFRIQIALDDLDFSKAWTGIWALVLLVAGFDFLFSRLGRHLDLKGTIQ